MRLRALALLGGLMLLLPAAAFAQSAGDKQYSDPFSGKVPTGASPDNPPSSSTPSQPQPQSQSRSLASTGQLASNPSQGQSAGTTGAGLPRTGSRAWILAVLGGLMMLGGCLLWLGVRPLARRAAGPSPPTLGRDIRLKRRRR